MVSRSNIVSPQLRAVECGAPGENFHNIDCKGYAERYYKCIVRCYDPGGGVLRFIFMRRVRPKNEGKGYEITNETGKKFRV